MKKSKWIVVITGLLFLSAIIYLAKIHFLEKERALDNLPPPSNAKPKKATLTNNPTPTGQDDAVNLEETFPSARLLILKDAVGADLRDYPKSTLWNVTFYAEPENKKGKKDDLALVADPGGKSCREKNPGILWADHKYECFKVSKSFKFKPKEFRGADIYVTGIGDIRAFYFINLNLTRKEFEAELVQGKDPAREAYAKIQAKIEAHEQRDLEVGASQ